MSLQNLLLFLLSSSDGWEGIDQMPNGDNWPSLSRLSPSTTHSMSYSINTDPTSCSDPLELNFAELWALQSQVRELQESGPRGQTVLQYLEMDYPNITEKKKYYVVHTHEP